MAYLGLMYAHGSRIDPGLLLFEGDIPLSLLLNCKALFLFRNLCNLTEYDNFILQGNFNAFRNF